MTFTELSAAGKDTIGTLNKTLEDKGRIDPAGTHNPDSSQVWGILEPGNSGRISGCITAPVAEKTQDTGVKLFTHSYTSAVSFSGIAPKASICEIICSLVKPPMDIAKVGQ